ncbi:MAG: type II toxin-antitoxin system VapC family toxin [Acidimicrobiales bacterium]
MIAYFDTSAVVPLIVSEPATERCVRLWNESSRIVSVRLLYLEARAAFARANRMGRITPTQLGSAVTDLDSIVAEVDHVEITADLAWAAGGLAQSLGLRGYDAVHLAAAHAVADGDLVLVTGDSDLAAAASVLGISVAATNS